MEALPKIEDLKKDESKYSAYIQLQHWFASHPNHPTVFDISSIGFHNWLKKNYPNYPN